MKSLRRVFGGLLVLLVVGAILGTGTDLSTTGPQGKRALVAGKGDPLIRAGFSPSPGQWLLERFGLRPAKILTPFSQDGAKGLDPDIVPSGGVDTRVNAVDPPDITSVQSETSIALNRNTGTLCVTYNDIYHWLEGLGLTGFSRSTDGGFTWQDGGHFPPGPGDIRSRGDPSVAWRAADGYFYYASLSDYGGGGGRGLSLWRSTDDCASFQWLVEVSYTGSDDKELLAIENNPASPYYGRIYLPWLVQADRLHYFTYSDDGGLSWSTPVLISDPSADYVAGAWPVVAPNGDVYVGWARWDAFPDGPIDQEIVRSTDGGDSFGPVTNPLDNAVAPRDAHAREYCGLTALNGFIRYLPSVQIAITPGDSGDPNDYCLHVTYPYDPDGYDVGDVTDVFYRRSCDYGATWEPEILVNDDGGLTDQFYPAITANEDGVVAISWYDRRNDPETNYFYERWGTVSYDGGDTWEPNRKIGDVVSAVVIDTLSGCNHGDYDMMVADEDYVYSVWVDDRVYFNGHLDQDIWFDKLPLWPDFELQSALTGFDLCRPDSITATLDLGSIFFYDQPVTLSDSGVPAGVNTSFSVNPVTLLPGSSVYTIDVTAGAVDGSYTWTVSGDSPTLTHDITVTLMVNSAIPVSPTLTDPPAGAVDLPLGHILFQWSDLPEATFYHLQVDDDPAFGSPEVDVSDIQTNSYDLPGQLDPTTIYYWRVAAANGCAESPFSDAFSFSTAAPCLLLVDDDDNAPDIRTHYQDALNRLGYAYDVFDVGGGTGNGPILAEMENYAMVIWFSGDKFGGGAGPNPTDESNLAAYLDGGGRLFLSSQDYLNDHGLSSFGQSYLGILSFGNNSGDDRLLYGQPGDPVGANMNYFPSYPSQYYRHPDTIVPAAGASVAFKDKNNNTVDIDKDGGAWRTVFFASSWETTHFINEARGTEIMGRIVNWFGGCAAPPEQPAIVVQPPSLEATLYVDEQLTQTLWISNVGGVDLTFNLVEMRRDDPPGCLYVGGTIGGGGAAALERRDDPPGRLYADPIIDPEVWAQVRAQGQAEVLIYLGELADLSPAYAIGDWEARGRFVYERLRETAERSGGELFAWLEEGGAGPRQLLAANAIVATVDAAMLEQVSTRPEVARVGPNSVITVPQFGRGEAFSPTTAPRDPAASEPPGQSSEQEHGNASPAPHPGGHSLSKAFPSDISTPTDEGRPFDLPGWSGEDGETPRPNAVQSLAAEPQDSSKPKTGNRLLAVEWNIAKIRADEAWATFGITGEGIVVGDIDTGAMYSHPALVQQYRGNLGGGSYDHNYNWFDLVNGQSAPYDDNGHGTMTTGVMVGDDGGANQIGVAPGARWIAVKVISGGGSTTVEDLHAALDWMLAPTDLSGNNPDPARRPQIGLNPWPWSSCSVEFQPDLQAWRAVNILPVFASGQSGPACDTAISPADLPEAVGAGSTDINDVVSSWSSRGPSCWGETKPEVAAPGVSIRSSTNGGSYSTVSGSSYSAAHLAGAAALVLSADPALDVSQIEAIITGTALCIQNLSCGGSACPDGPNNVYGWGRIDAFKAVSLTLGGPPPLYDIPWLSEDPVSGTVAPSESIPIAVTYDSTGLIPSVYLGQLEVESNDPLTPRMSIPVTLTVLPPCEPVQIVTVTTAISGCAVSFGAELTGTSPFSWLWDFSAFGSSTDPTPTVDFGNSGTYPYTLTVLNCGGVYSDSHAGQVTVACCQPVTATAFSWLPLTPTAGQVVTFTASASGTEPISYSWRLRVGELGIGTEITHVYTVADEYEVTLTATNSCGEEVVTHTVTVVPYCEPVHGADLSWVPLTPTAGQVVTFTASASGTTPISYTWDLGDGLPPLVGWAGPFTHTYAAAGLYTVTLTAANACGQAIVQQPITVLALLWEWRVYLPLVVK